MNKEEKKEVAVSSQFCFSESLLKTGQDAIMPPTLPSLPFEQNSHKLQKLLLKSWTEKIVY